MRTKRSKPLLIALGMAVLVLVLWGLGFLQNLENRSIDYRFMLRGQIAPSDKIVIVTADEESFKVLGRWPWPRSTHAKLIDILNNAGAKAIVFDILFSEPDKEHPEADRALAEAARRSGKVVFCSMYQMEHGMPVNPIMPIRLLKDAAPTGFSNIWPELDGVTRKAALMMQYQDNMLPSLSMQGLSIYTGKSPKQVLAYHGITLSDTINEIPLNFYGGYESFKYISFYKAVTGEVPAGEFKDKIVLIGGTAAGLFDFKAMPFSPTYPGVEVHATAMSNILRDDFLDSAPWWLTLLLVLFFATCAGWALSGLQALYGALSCLAMFIGYYAACCLFFSKAHYDLEAAAPLLSLALSYGAVVFYRFMTEEKEKRKIKNTIGHYINRQLLEKVLADPGLLKLGGDRKNLSVLFSDIRGFTTISESMKPEEVVPLLNEYLSKMVDVVFRNDGTLDKFIGDAVMAFWGAPVPDELHPRKAVMCAIEMIEELKLLQEKWRREGKPVIEIGIGVNTGDMVVGNMGSGQKMEYTVIGDNVNLGSRLEGLNKEYHTRIIVSEATFLAVQDLVEAQLLGSVKVKGKTKEVTIYQILGRKGEISSPAGHFDPDKRLTIEK